MNSCEQPKKKWGDRSDARWIKDITGLQKTMIHLFPRRVDCEAYLDDKLDVTELLKYIDRKNAEHPEYKTTVFHCFIFAIAKMIYERPAMNRFISGYRMYERNDITYGFVAKRRFADLAEEALIMLKAKADDTLDKLSKSVTCDISEMRKSESGDSGLDGTLNALGKLPRFLLIPLYWIVRILDFWGKNPKSFMEGNINYASVFLSNLGSIKCSAVYHHLNNYGSNCFFVTVGTLHKEEVIMEDGHKEIRDILPYSAIIDERIADGFYYVRSLKLIKYIMANPDILDLPLSQSSGFDYV